MNTHLASRSPLLRMPRALAVTSLLALLSGSCSPHLATSPDRPPADGSGVPLSSSISSVDGQVVVTLAPGASAAAVAAAYNATLIAVEQGFAVLVPQPNETLDDLQLQMKNDSRILTYERNSMVMPAEARQKSWSFDDGFGSFSTFSSQPVTSAMGLVQAHALCRSQAATVAILDTGVDPGHPLFAGRIVGGWDFVDNDSDPTDVLTGVDSNGDGVPDGAYGHGTHVAGIVALTAPTARLLIGRVLDSEGRGDVRTVAAGIRWAVANGAKVINLSLGLLRTSSAIAVALREAEAQGVVCVASAGNWGAATPVEYPASSATVIAVAADDAYSRPAAFSSYGSFVAVAAPGVDVRSAFPGGGYRLWSGTSMSAPFVSGTAAIVKGLRPEWTRIEVLSLLRSGAHPLSGMSTAQFGQFGSGAIDLYDVLKLLGAPPDLQDRVAGDLETSP